LGGAAAQERVYDEELVDALWTRREQVQEGLVEATNALLPDLRIDSVSLEGVAPANSVVVRLVFAVSLEAASAAATADLSAALIVVVSETLGISLGGPVAVSAFPEPPAAAVARAGAAATPLGRLTPLLAAVGSGIGVIGFVTFMGGTIVWARVRAAGLPAAPTLGVFPKQDLLVIGAETLVPMFLTALLGVAILAIGYAIVRALLIRYGPHGHRLLNHELRYRAGEETRLATVGMFLFVLLALAVPLVGAYDNLSLKEAIAASAGVLVGAMVAAAVASSTRRFVYLATTTFVLSAIFLGFLAYWRAGHEELIRGAAIIRDNKKAVTGIYVAEGSGRVYLALLNLDGGKIDKSKSRLVGIAKSQVTDIAIADRKTPQGALDQATAMAKDLCEEQPKLVPATGGQIENCATAPPGDRQP
jgi:hypothetical protein